VSRRPSSRETEPRPPPGLSAETFELGNLQFVLFELPLELGAPASFTPAERAVLRHIARGLSSREIARERGSSERTVANQLASMYRKLNVNSRQELIAALLESEGRGLDPAGRGRRSHARDPA